MTEISTPIVISICSVIIIICLLIVICMTNTKSAKTKQCSCMHSTPQTNYPVHGCGCGKYENFTKKPKFTKKRWASEYFKATTNFLKRPTKLNYVKMNKQANVGTRMKILERMEAQQDTGTSDTYVPIDAFLESDVGKALIENGKNNLKESLKEGAVPGPDGVDLISQNILMTIVADIQEISTEVDETVDKGEKFMKKVHIKNRREAYRKCTKGRREDFTELAMLGGDQDFADDLYDKFGSENVDKYLEQVEDIYFILESDVEKLSELKIEKAIEDAKEDFKIKENWGSAVRFISRALPASTLSNYNNVYVPTRFGGPSTGRSVRALNRTAALLSTVGTVDQNVACMNGEAQCSGVDGYCSVSPETAEALGAPEALVNRLRDGNENYGWCTTAQAAAAAALERAADEASEMWDAALEGVDDLIGDIANMVSAAMDGLGDMIDDFNPQNLVNDSICSMGLDACGLLIRSLEAVKTYGISLVINGIPPATATRLGLQMPPTQSKQYAFLRDGLKATLCGIVSDKAGKISGPLGTVTEIACELFGASPMAAALQVMVDFVLEEIEDFVNDGNDAQDYTFENALTQLRDLCRQQFDNARWGGGTCDWPPDQYKSRAGELVSVTECASGTGTSVGCTGNQILVPTESERNGLPVMTCECEDPV